MSSQVAQLPQLSPGVTAGRWKIALAGVAIQFMLGTVYAWSVFKRPLLALTGWSEIPIFGFALNQQVTFTFSLTIFFLGFSAALGGRLVDRAGTRFVATLAAVLFGGGTLLAGLAVSLKSMALLWLGYGVIAGIGNGLGYVTPVAVLLRWFPDKKGTITGLAVMGFGLGAAAMAQAAPLLMNGAGISGTFFLCGAVFLVSIALAAQKLVNPPAGYAVGSAKVQASAGESMTFSQATRTWQFYILWSLLLLNVFAGIALISNLSPMAESLLSLSAHGTRNSKSLSAENQGQIALIAASIVLATQLCNGVGRMFWGFLSERIGRKNVFLLLFATQAPLFFLLPYVESAALFAIIACWILLCYGGGFGTMPSFAADTFGPKHIGSIYGLILLAWGVAGAAGPTIMERAQSISGSFDSALRLAGCVLVAGLAMALLYRKPKAKE